MIEDNPIDLNLPGIDGLALVRELGHQLRAIATLGVFPGRES